MSEKNNCSSWGIFRGFSAIQQRIENWQPPVCPKCKKELKPWIDWIYHGSIGYCTECRDLYAVRYFSQPSPNYHIRFEIEELKEHYYHKIEFDTAWITPQQVWDYYEKVPTAISDIEFINCERKKLSSFNYPESKLAEHLLWRIIFNSEHFDKALFLEYLKFVIKYPHFYKIFNEYEIWLGYELDLAVNIEKYNKEDIYETIYELWKQLGNEYSISHFNSTIGIFVIKEYFLYKKHESEFDDFLSKVIVRKF